MKRLYNLLHGTVRLSAQGERCERVLNYCAENGIEFWDASPREDFAISFTVRARDYPALSELDGKNGIEIKLIASRGGRELTRAAKRRAVLLILLVCVVSLLSVSSLFLWKIEIEGNERVTDAELLRALSDCGVSYGAFWPALSSDEVRSRIVSELEDIAWLSLNVRSSRAVVTVHERIYKPEIADERTPCDVVASRGGIIRSLSVLEGSTLCAVGQTVAEGDVLAGALMQSKTGDDRTVHASAVVIADTWHEITAETPLYEAQKETRNGSSGGFSIIIGKMRINFFSDSRNKSTSCDKINKLRYVSLGDAFVLPVGYASLRTTEYETKLRHIDKTVATERLKETLIKELERRIDGGEIIAKDFSVSETNEMLVVTLRAQCRENIAEEAAYD